MAEALNVKSHHYFSIVGIIFGFVALSLSFLSPWVEARFAPKQETVLEESVKKKVSGWKNKILNKVTGAETKINPETKPLHWTDYWILVVIGLAVIGIGSALAGFLRKENLQMVLTAAGLGASAVILQYALIYVAFVLCLLVILWLFSYLGAVL